MTEIKRTVILSANDVEKYVYKKELIDLILNDDDDRWSVKTPWRINFRPMFFIIKIHEIKTKNDIIKKERQYVIERPYGEGGNYTFYPMLITVPKDKNQFIIPLFIND